jgi:hypothetical protein
MKEAHNNLVVLAAKAGGHVTATLVIAALLGVVAADLSALELLFQATWAGGYDPNWGALALHLGLSAAVWGSGVLLYRVLHKRGKKAVKVYKARGAVMLETLVALVPFLLLTSGIAQYAMINVAGIISDLAVYQAARTAWLWQPEAEIGRNGVNMDDVEFRARTAAALTLAPTAASNFTVGRNNPGGSGPPFRRIRTAVAASFNQFPVSGENFWIQTNYNWAFFGNQNMNASAENLTFTRALDSDSFYLRAGRKVTSAWMCLEDFEIIDENDEVGARFTYQYALLFPWFAYIFGDTATIATRFAHHMPIRREMTFPEQPDM